MELMDKLGLVEALHVLSQSLIVPVVLALLLLVVYSVYTIGALIVEALAERRHYKAVIPELIDDLEAAGPEELDRVIEKSGLLTTQREALHEVVRHMDLPETALEEVARTLLNDESKRYRKSLSWTDSFTKIGPMLGLMGTLIPLGPGIVALSSGDLKTLSSSLLVAFDTTVTGLVVAIICFLVSKKRRVWYDEYLIGLEGALNTILEKAALEKDGGDHGEA